MEEEPAAYEFNLRVIWNHPPEFIDVNPILLRADGAVQEGLGLQCEPAVDEFQFLDDSGQDFRSG